MFGIHECSNVLDHGKSEHESQDEQSLGCWFEMTKIRIDVSHLQDMFGQRTLINVLDHGSHTKLQHHTRSHESQQSII